VLTYLIFATALAIILFLLGAPLVRARRRRQLEADPFPVHWHQQLMRDWPLYARLSDALREGLQRRLRVMMSETLFYGCNGLEVTEAMRLRVLAQAALIYGNVLEDRVETFPRVLLYPGPFVRHGKEVDELGLVREGAHSLLGESWEQGRVILSWPDVREDLGHLDGHNLVIHEYAHQLDGLDGVMNGTPPLAGKPGFEPWPQVMQAAYDNLCRRLEVGEEPIDAYAATNPAEFFAVVSETFFTLPQALHQAYPEVYRLLVAFYRLEPLEFAPSVPPQFFTHTRSGD
jgi:Mlc titration factor MtfA (ptsG expression regulator)